MSLQQPLRTEHAFPLPSWFVAYDHVEREVGLAPEERRESKIFLIGEKQKNREE